MPILNYTTEVEYFKTIGEIQGILAKGGARQVTTEYDAKGDPCGVTFLLVIEERPIGYRLPRNAEGVLEAMKRARVERRYLTLEQAKRVSWRILKDWIAAQLAIVEANQAQLAEVFLPYAIDSRTGQTMFQKFYASLALPPAPEETP